MNNAPLRIEQNETVLFNANLNPLGVPESVKRAIKENISSIVKYPDIYYTKLKKAVAEYVNVSLDNVVIGNGSTDLLKLFAALITPKKVKLISPSSSEYENVFKAFNAELDFYDLDEDFHLMIVQSCPNVYIRRSYEMIRTQNERFRHMTAATYVKRLEDSYTEHLEILRACLAQDWNDAAERMRIHIEKSRVAAVDRAFEYMKRTAE